MFSERAVLSVGGALRGGPVGPAAARPAQPAPAWPFPKPDAPPPPPLPARLQLYPAPPLALAEPVIAALQQRVQSYTRASRIARLTWMSQRAGRPLPDPDLGFWPLFWMTPVLEHMGEGVERRF